MDRWQNRVAVVTGASSGIGAAVAKDLVYAGCITVALARREDRLQALRQQLPAQLRNRLHVLKCDVSDLQAVSDAFDWIETRLHGVDILIANAGILYPGQLLTMPAETLQQILQVNLMGVIHCVQCSFRSMQQRNVNGHIVLLNSLTGHVVFNPPGDALPILNMYPLTKHAITALLEVLRQELRGFKTKIKVTSITPGITETEILPAGFEQLPMLQPQDISNGILYALGTPPHVQVHELTIKPLGEPI